LPLRLSPDALGLTCSTQAGGNQRKVRCDTALEDVGGLVAIIHVVRVGNGLAFREHHHPPGILDRQHAPEQSVGDAEDSGVGGNAQGDRNDDYHCEAGNFHQGSNGVADILQQCLHRWPPLGETGARASNPQFSPPLDALRGLVEGRGFSPALPDPW